MARHPYRFDRDAAVGDHESGAAEAADRLAAQPQIGAAAAKSAPDSGLPALRVSANRRYLEQAGGAPFFWLGDTAWELFHRLNAEEAAYYLRTRAEQGFTVVQAVLLAELQGVTTPSAAGRLPLKIGASGLPDPSLPDTDGDDSYWRHVDAVLDEASRLGLYMALLPTWGDKFNQMHGAGPEIFTADNAYAYGRWLGERYGGRGHLVWVLGGDRPLSTVAHFAIVDGMVRGLKAGGARQLMTFHPKGAESSSHHMHGEDWLDFNMIQSGHGEREIANDKRVAADYGRTPVKPTLDGEPCYEDIPIGFRSENGYFDAADVRRAAYRAVLSGAFGHTYGHHSVWPMAPEPGLYASTDFVEAGDFFLMGWRQALRRPGAEQMRHLRALIAPHLGSAFRPAPELLASNRSGDNRMASARSERIAWIYSPNGLYVDVDPAALGSGAWSAGWFCPRTGIRSEALPTAIAESGGSVARFVAPGSGRGCDWILTIEEE
ncbi:DUF4038 domain-containing protein [Saccharibacillus sacchari]|uniref:DUF4038 domain-containing protein n=1 Tax=Saccharibacillus sacchari TaxID=456493 RepID=A0ACC6PHD0_9BACL